jgi:hypothetical protein
MYKICINLLVFKVVENILNFSYCYHIIREINGKKSILEDFFMC